MYPNYDFRVGEVVIDEPTKFRISYETASWYKDIEVPPGRYPLCASSGNLKWIVASLEGTVTESFFQNRLFTATSNHVNEHVGEKDSASIQLDTFSAARADGKYLKKADGGGYRIELDPEVCEVIQVGEYRDGEPMLNMRLRADKLMAVTPPEQANVLVTSSGSGRNTPYVLVYDADGDTVTIHDASTASKRSPEFGHEITTRSAADILAHESYAFPVLPHYSGHGPAIGPDQMEPVKEWLRGLTPTPAPGM